MQNEINQISYAATREFWHLDLWRGLKYRLYYVNKIESDLQTAPLFDEGSQASSTNLYTERPVL